MLMHMTVCDWYYTFDGQTVCMSYTGSRIVNHGSEICESIIRLLSLCWCTRFYRAAWNADAVLRWDFCLSVCLSVCPSVKRVHCDKTEEKSVQIFIPCERSFRLVLWEKEWLLGATPSIWNFGSTGPRWSEIADFEPIIARSASPYDLAKKVQLTLIGSPLRAFQRA